MKSRAPWVPCCHGLVTFSPSSTSAHTMAKHEAGDALSDVEITRPARRTRSSYATAEKTTEITEATKTVKTPKIMKVVEATDDTVEESCGGKGKMDAVNAGKLDSTKGGVKGKMEAVDIGSLGDFKAISVGAGKADGSGGEKRPGKTAAQGLGGVSQPGLCL
ncbi:hypothetical protein K470DRAFT_47191 [Piedraia hortae CBS 480.64]|uniref:Uncharacterized protein n=1 Tax=Piedraia hortae CBS 480.64 TaxID=1314780 RepID=A0A6A7C0P5_9PEZI|nr:hypothetical protein K470DRAFT_47191 [Piedraia hortae CBS 480.64]